MTVGRFGDLRSIHRDQQFLMLPSMRQVAIVTERLASQIFDDAALGRSLRVSTPFRGAVKADVRIVGIVESPVGLSGEEVAAIFFPSPFPSPIQHGTARTLHVRSEGPAAALAPAIRDLVAQLDPRVPILELGTLDQKIRADFSAPTRAGEGGGTPGHRGAPARQHRPLRSDLL